MLVETIQNQQSDDKGSSSVDVLKLILSQPEVDVNFSCGLNKSTALHCVAPSGSVVQLLLSAGVDSNFMDANGHHPVDVIIVLPKFPGIKACLEELLMNNISDHNIDKHNLWKEYPTDLSLSDLKSSIYSTDEFRMSSFKVRPCSRAYSHDWTECPFVHPRENARSRDPRKYHYSCVPCPDLRKGAYRRRDMCEYAHGAFECWLHPAQYRTRHCKDGTSYVRRACFLHTQLRSSGYCTSLLESRELTGEIGSTAFGDILPEDETPKEAFSITNYDLIN
ncbi:hypothetical protein F0562_015850 [Nyssa sinensis]|uniref:AtC3H23-like CCCH zinc finger domain-containing protein n=1 Tax=Nyssa sinensis TaxID=561372 RepID=A0A5J4ZLW8_9ASTE|nr:hypothetical protein F0562_015850 [Nyssa sinensis]